MHRESSGRSRIATGASTRSRISTGLIVALTAAGIASGLLTACDRTISDNGSWLAEFVR